ncbi:MAG TPA: hypothetical protein VEB59_02990 [Gemmatimonadales bacterium]|nr:hypothetical protein [Gemmatimonadales bacterium]
MPFIPLAVLTNTVFPMPFEPVLLWFAGRAAAGDVWMLAGVGSACAGAAAVVDAGIVGAVGRGWRRRRLPRDLVTLLLWRSLAPPRWVGGALVLAAGGCVLFDRRPRSTEA